mmetsp:Transcript_98653/g.255041  ORF Transcript_98653/g.255041 Transcript_98653/m.255041 type:complete len:247 (+) Transcript_98653:90-830(+)
MLWHNAALPSPFRQRSQPKEAGAGPWEYGLHTVTLPNCMQAPDAMCGTKKHSSSRRSHGAVSEEVGLLHDAKELLLVDLPITIPVCLVNHLLQLLISHAFAKLLGNALQVLEGDLAGLVVVEEAEGLQDFVLGITVEDLVRHHLQELLVADGAAAIIIDIRDHLLDLLLLGLEAQGAHGDLQLLGVDLAGAIRVEQVERLLDLLLLLVSKLLLLLAASVETTQGHGFEREGMDGGRRWRGTRLVSA